MADFTVVRFGTDPSGRPIFGTQFMIDVWNQILADPDVAPFASKVVIVQGAFMERVAGGGAAASAGYHDKAGCWDIRTWNLTADELERFIRAARRNGWAFWRRDKLHGGMESHAHGVLGTDQPLAAGAAHQWQQYIAGGDGLASNGPDYEWRPNPLVTTPPKPPELTRGADVDLTLRDAWRAWRHAPEGSTRAQRIRDAIRSLRLIPQRPKR